MPKFALGDTALVPCSLVGLEDQPHAIHKSQVVEVNGRSVRLSLPGGQTSGLIGSGRVHRDVGLGIFCIGDFETELGVLDPLAKSVLQYCRLLLPDDRVLLRKVRALDEFGKWFEREGDIYTHVILVGHGSPTSISFGMTGDASVENFRQQIEPHISSPKYFISLCCKTGYATFGREFSRLAHVCRGIVAPFHSVHGAIASQFCQTILADHLLEGYSFGVAFDHARDAVPSVDIFRLWQAGRLAK
jgi:hypothetical protein